MRKGFFLIVLLAMISSLHAQEIKNVSFVQEGEISKVIIETDTQATAERFHVSEDKQIILDVKNVKVSPKLLRGIDTSEFPGSAVYISGYKKPGAPNDVRFAIQLRDNVRSILETNDKKITLAIENRFGVFSKSKLRAVEAGSPAPGGQVEDSIGLNVPKSSSIEDILENLTMSGPKKYIGKRISINVKEIPVPDLLNMIADTSGFNIIIDQEISKAHPLTLTLTNVPWDQALDTIMSLSNLVAEKNANILVVKTSAQAVKEGEEKLKALAQKAGLEPLVTRVFLINYAGLEDIKKIITDYVTPSRGNLQSDDRTNSLIVKDTVDSIERIKKIIETLDTQTPQILIEAKIVEANESYVKRLGLAKGISFGYDPMKNITGVANVGPGFSFASAPDSTAPGVLGMTVAVYRRLLNLDMNLQLMESESKGRIISTPKVVTQNKKEAQIVSTEQTSFRVVQATTGGVPGLSSFQNITADLKLTVKPQVSNDGAISMEINIEKSAFGTRPSPDAPPNQTKRTVKTNVLVDNGSTVVLGGVYQTTTLQSYSGIPFLKDLPLLGWLFRTPYNPETTKNELIVFLTPRILNQDEAGMIDRQAGKATTLNGQL